MSRRVKSFSFTRDRIAPRKVASALASQCTVRVALPVAKVKRLLAAVPGHFDGYLRLRIEPRNTGARELVGGTLAGAALGVAAGVIWRVLGRVHPVVIIATAIAGAGVGYLTVRYKVSVYVRYPQNGPPRAELIFRNA